LNAAIEAILNELSEGGEVTIIGFGTFGIFTQPEMVSTDPKTNKLVHTPAKKIIAQKPGKHITEKLGLSY
jgi:nucleoid DNA-binding protein